MWLAFDVESIGFGLTNDTNQTLSSFTLGYLGRQWRTNGDTPGNLVVQFKLGGAFDNDNAGWTDINALTFTGSNTTGSTSIDGYLAGNIATLSTTVSDVEWNHGQALWIRWRDFNDAGTDAQLAIDDVSFSAIPEPSTWLLITFGLSALIIRRKLGSITA
jgi:hypothetical protein